MMDQILPGLFVGSFEDSRDKYALESRNITHILSIIENPVAHFKHISYLLIHAHDSPQQDLLKFFDESIEFLHKARTSGGSVLVHCRVGMSRSVTLTIAYIMSITKLNFPTVMNSVRGARKIAYPNYGFQKQLEKFEFSNLKATRRRIQQEIGPALPGDESIALENEELFWKQFDRKPYSTKSSFNHISYLPTLLKSTRTSTVSSQAPSTNYNTYNSSFSNSYRSTSNSNHSYTNDNNYYSNRQNYRSSSLSRFPRASSVSKSYVTIRPYNKTHWTFY